MYLGLCQGSLFDNVFEYVLKDKEFIGFGNTRVSVDEKEKEIRLKLHENNLTYAILSKPSPIGFNQWQVINDTCNEEYVNYTATLNFNSCFNSEFSCPDGSW